MFEIHDPETNNAKASRFGNQIHQNREHSASIHSHPRMMLGTLKRLAELRERLVNDRDNGIPALLGVMSLIREMDDEPFPGFTEDMTAELEFIQRELGALDPNQPSQARHFAAIGKRLDSLSRTLLFVVERWVSTTDFSKPDGFSSDSDAIP